MCEYEEWQRANIEEVEEYNTSEDQTELPEHDDPDE